MNSDELSDFYTSIIKNASYFERKCESKEEAIKQFNNLNGGQQSITPTRKGIAQLYGWYNEERCNKERYNKDIERFLFELSNMPEKDLKGRKSSMDFLCLYLYYRGKAEYRESNIAKELADLKNRMITYWNIFLIFISKYGIKISKIEKNIFLVNLRYVRLGWICILINIRQ